jgi:DNA polymerase II small subunit
VFLVGGSLKSAYDALIVSGYQVSPEAFAMLGEIEDPEHIVALLLKALGEMKEKPLIIERSNIESLLKIETQLEVEPESPPPPVTTNLSPSTVIVMGESEIHTIKGTVNDFRGYFINRFERLQSILKARADLRDATSASLIPAGNKPRKVKIIGMVRSKSDFKGGGSVVELEDMQGSVRISFREDEQIREKVSRLLLDEVVCIYGSTTNGTFIRGEDIVWPDIAPRIKTGSKKEIYAVLTSDLHIGSKLFMKEQFESFINWIKAKETEGREVALKTKYLIIAGDLVDGVGIYPNQEEELQVKDLNKQYEQAAEYLSMIPENIKIIIIPGNHDACRPTLPTPPIYREYAEPVYALKNVVMLGDPALVNLEGVVFLLTHGRSLDDVIPAIPNCDFKRPHIAMVELLKARHIAPIYGAHTPLAPEPFDSLVIDPVPDVFQAGHVHVWGGTEYRGVVVVNSGAWQRQTNFQRSNGIEPVPGVVPVLNLSNFKTNYLNFL